MKAKKWLRENKIFFETLTPLVTAVIGFATLFLGMLTFNLQHMQNDLQRKEFLPQFIVETILSTTTPTTEIIQIYHRGGGYSAFSAQTFSKYEVTLPTDFDSAARPIIVPVNDYFTDHFFRTYENLAQGQSDGLIDIITSTSTAYEIVLAVQQSYNKDTSPEQYKSLWFKSYLAIGYNDIFGKRHVEYYFIFPNFSYKIPVKKGEEIFAQRYEFFESIVSSFDSLDKVIQTAQEQKTPSPIQKILKWIERRRNERKMNEFYMRTTGCNFEDLMECDPSGPG